MRLSWNGFGRKIYLNGKIVMEWYRIDAAETVYRIYFFNTNRAIDLRIVDNAWQDRLDA